MKVILPVLLLLLQNTSNQPFFRQSQHPCVEDSIEAGNKAQGDYHLVEVDPQKSEMFELFCNQWGKEFQHDTPDRCDLSSLDQTSKEDLGDNQAQFPYVSLIVSGEGMACGFLQYQIHEDIVSLESLFLERQYRGQGIGTKILTQFIYQLKSEGFRSILLNVVVQNDAAIGLYEKLGFKKVASFNNHGMEGFVMKKELCDSMKS